MQELLTVEEFSKRKLLKEGHWFSLPLDSQARMGLNSDITGISKEQIVSNEEGEQHLFRYVKEISGEGSLNLLGEASATNLRLQGWTGFKNGENDIQEFCRCKYEIVGEINARSITEEEHEELPEKFQYGRYWLPKAFEKNYNNIHIAGILYFNGQTVDKSFLLFEGEGLYKGTHKVRPVISLYGSNVKILVDSKHNGKKKETAYEIVIPKRKETPGIKVESLSQQEFISRNFLREGCWFRLHLNPNVDTQLDKALTGYSKIQEIKNSKGETWIFRYVENLNKGKVLLLLGEPSECMVYLSGRKGHDYGVIAINKFCKTKYGIDGKVGARSITWDEYVELDPKFQYGEYWLPEKYVRNKVLGMQCVIGQEETYVCLQKSRIEDGKSKAAIGCDCNAVRPVISIIGENVKIIVGQKHDGKKASTAYEILIEE